MTWKQSQILQYAVNFCQTTLVLVPRGIARIIGRGRRGGGRICGGCFQRIIKSIDCGGKLINLCLQHGIRSGQLAYLAWGSCLLADRQVRRFRHDLFLITERLLGAKAGNIQY